MHAEPLYTAAEMRAVEEAYDRSTLELSEESKLLELACPVRQQRDARAKRLQCGRGFVDPTWNVPGLERKRQRQPPDTAPDDRDFIAAVDDHATAPDTDHRSCSDWKRGRIMCGIHSSR